MKVLCVGNLYPPHDRRGGYEQVWRDAVAALRSAGHRVRVLASDHRAADRPVEEEPEVFRELRWYWRDHRFPRIGVRDRVRLERDNGAVLERHLDELRPDVVAWWSMGGMSLSLIERVRRAGIGAVFFVHDDWPIYGPKVDAWCRLARRRPGLAALIERRTAIPAQIDLNAAGRWLFVSEVTRERARREGGLVALDSGVAHSGVDRAFLEPAPEREWGWELLYVGRVEPRKGVEFAVAALAELPDEARLSVIGVGEPEYLESLRAQAARLGVGERLTLAGGVDRGALYGAYAGADAVLFPVRWEEPWGLVPLEAMGVGRPVVASGRGGSSEYLRDDSNCLLFDVDDPASLAAALRRLATEPALRARLRSAGYETAQRHTAAAFNDMVVRELEAAT
ncbi:MAG TPA: glycosyltransferase family 4 protein [Solirubrobacteraceae bacterium]|nr:glycosyltransferase family 4 protein [Solirubrobacteraceae bacterium]